MIQFILQTYDSPGGQGLLRSSPVSAANQRAEQYPCPPGTCSWDVNSNEFMTKIPHEASKTIKTLENAGHEAYIVGGSVRDMLLGEVPKDFDITTSALPEEIKGLFPRTVDIGIKHGTVAVIVKGGKIEVTTYRIDGEYENHRRPKHVDFTSDIKEDLSRRDFTINAIAYNPAGGFIDPFCGIKDIQKKIVRCVGSATKRFGEDALRMVRAVRFAATLGFEVDGEIKSAIKENKEKLNAVSAERVSEELVKLVMGKYPEALRIMEETGFFPYVLRGGEVTLKSERFYPVWDHIESEHMYTREQNINSMDALVKRLKTSPADLHARLAVLFDCICKNYTDVLDNLKFDNRSKKIASIYMTYMHIPIVCDKYEIKKILQRVPTELFDNLLAVKNILGTGEPFETIRRLKNEIIHAGECYKIKHLAINGDDLTKNGVKPGPEMGDLLEKLLDAVMKKPELNERERLLSMVGVC